MTDHPLTSDPVRQYLDEQNLEKVMNTGINKILREKPTDALSALAVFLTSNAEKKPVFDKFECEKTLIGGKYRSFDTHVYIDFAGEIKCRHTHTFTYSNEDFTDAEDSQAHLDSLISQAIDVITSEVTALLHKSDLSLIKKTDLALKKFYEENYAGSGDEEGKNQDLGKLVVRVCSEALVHGVAK